MPWSSPWNGFAPAIFILIGIAIFFRYPRVGALISMVDSGRTVALQAGGRG
jgi:hypothetical protein